MSKSVPSDHRDITVLLHRWHAGDQAAAEELFALLQCELRAIASRCLRRDGSKHSVRASDLLNEGFLKLKDANRVIDWRDRGHLFAIFTIKLRHFLIDRARANAGSNLVSLEDIHESSVSKLSGLETRVAVDRLLDQLEQESPIACSIVVARTYLGYETKEIATKIGLPLRTVERHLHNGRKWLFDRLSNKSV